MCGGCRILNIELIEFCYSVLCGMQIPRSAFTVLCPDLQITSAKKHFSPDILSPHQQKNCLLQRQRAGVWTACVHPIRSVRPERPRLSPVRPVGPERPGILQLHLLFLVPPNALVPVLTTQRTCQGLIPSEHPPSVSSGLGVSGVYLSDSGTPMA